MPTISTVPCSTPETRAMLSASPSGSLSLASTSIVTALAGTAATVTSSGFAVGGRLPGALVVTCSRPVSVSVPSLTT